MSEESQIVRVLDAVDGMVCFTCADVLAATGLPRKHCSAYIGKLLRGGFVRETGRVVRNYDAGRPAKVYELVKI